MQPGAIGRRFQFEIVLERVRRVGVCTRDSGDVGQPLAIHEGGLPTLGLIDVPVVKAHGYEHGTRKSQLQRLSAPKAIRCTMAHCGGRTSRPASGFGDGSLHSWIFGERRGGQPFLKEGNIGINGGEPVKPVTTEPGKFPEGDVRNVDPLGRFGQSGPGGTRRAIGFDRLLQRGAIARARVNPIQDAGAEFCGEKSTQTGLNRNIDVDAPDFSRLRRRSQIFQPLRDLDGRIFAAPLSFEQLIHEIIDAGEELWIERASVAEDFGCRGVGIFRFRRLH